MKKNSMMGGNQNRLARLGVPPGTIVDLPDNKRPESGDFDILPIFQGCRNFFENSVEDLSHELGCVAGVFRLFEDSLDNVESFHAFIAPRSFSIIFTACIFVNGNAGLTDSTLAFQNEFCHFPGQGISFRQKTGKKRPVQRPVVENFPEICTQGANVSGGISGPSESNSVQGPHGMGSVNDAEGRNIATGASPPSQEGQTTDSYKLVNQDGSGDEDLILHDHMSCKKSAVGEDHFVPKLAIVCHMGLRHQKVMVSDMGLRPLFCGPVNRHIFPDFIAVSNPGGRDRSLVGMILGLMTDNGSHVDTVVFSENDARSDRDPFKKNSPAPDSARSPEDTIWPDGHIVSQFDIAFQNGRRMNAGVTHGERFPTSGVHRRCCLSRPEDWP